MFEVYNKECKIQIVYGVQFKNGYPFFTIYEDGQWKIKSAKLFIPVKEMI